MSDRDSKQRTTGNQGLLAVTRAFSIIEILAQAELGLSLSDVARKLGVNKQIAFRLLETLEAEGYVYKYPHTENFKLSYKLSNIGHRKMMQEKILDQASSVIRELADATGELARLAIAEKDNLMWVLAALSPQRMLNINPNYAPEITLYSTAAGKAWLSTMTKTEADRALDRKPPQQRTPYTIVDRDRFHKELARVRKVGWAISFEESELGIGAVAAPIIVNRYDGVQMCVGTISLAAPTQRMDRQAITAAAPAVVSTAGRLAKMWPQFPSEDIEIRQQQFRLA